MSECVYNLIKPPAEHTTKGTMYRSKYNPKAPPSNDTAGPKKAAGTFGKEVVETINPRNFLKRGEKIRSLPEPQKFERPDASSRKSDIPKRTEKPVMGLTTEKNFVVSNAVDNILTAPKNKGSEVSVPATVNSTFGKVPNYLKKIKRNINDEYAYLSQVNQDAGAVTGDPRLALFQENEKAELIAALKLRWEEVHKQYQALTFNIDTVTKTHRKETIEITLEQIEKAIQKLSKKTIYVFDDC